MIEFLYHDGIQKEVAALERRFRNIKDGLAAFERLAVIAFLCIGTHVDNYNDEEMNRLALLRLSDLF